MERITVDPVSAVSELSTSTEFRFRRYGLVLPDQLVEDDLPDEVVDAAVQRLLDDRVRRGLPRQVSDPIVLTAVANILREAAEQQPVAPGRRQRSP